MPSTREIKRRMKAVANIQRITKTMQMIATARFQSAQRSATAAQPYTAKITQLVNELASVLAGDDSSNVTHPLLRSVGGGGRSLLLVLTSNRGLCGGYNASVLRTASAYLKEHAAPASPQSAGTPGTPGTDVEVIGKKGVGYFRFARIPVAATYTEFGDKPQYRDIEQLGEKYMQQFIAGEYDAVAVAYMSFQTASRQTPAVATLLPLADPLADKGAADSAGAAKTDYEFSPDPQQLLNELLPVTVKMRLWQCMNEAIVSEHIARMVAMKNATDSAGKMGKELTRKYNRARQTAITTELSEIIGGAAALE